MKNEMKNEAKERLMHELNRMAWDAEKNVSDLRNLIDHLQSQLKRAVEALDELENKKFTIIPNLSGCGIVQSTGNDIDRIAAELVHNRKMAEVIYKVVDKMED